MIKFKCKKCGERLKAPNSFIKHEFQCPNCQHKGKVPKPRPATDRQKEYAKNVGFIFSQDVSFDDLSKALDCYENIKYFIWEVWRESTGKKLKECDVSGKLVDEMVQKIISHPKLKKTILHFRDIQYDQACEAMDAEQNSYYKKHGDNASDFPKSLKDYMCSIRNCPAFMVTEKMLKTEWPEFLTKKSFFEKLF